MKATQRLHELGQSLWLDNITRVMLMDGTLRRYIAEFSVSGLTSNPTIFDHAIRNGGSYDSAIRQKTAQGKSGEGLFFDLALEDLTQAADLSLGRIWARQRDENRWRLSWPGNRATIASCRMSFRKGDA